MPKVASIRFTDLVPLGWSSLRRNRLRTLLTVGAIAFGVSILVYLVSLGIGLENLTVGSVLRSSALLSFNVTTFNKEIKPLNQAAFTQIEQLEAVEKVLPKMTVRGEVVLAGTVWQATINGVDPDYFSLNDQNPLKIGRPFTEGETNSMLVSTSFLKLFGLGEDKTPLVAFDINLDAEYGPTSNIKNATVRGVIADDAAVEIYLPRAYLESLLTRPPDYQEMTVLVSDLSKVEQATSNVIADGYRVTTVVDTVEEIKRVFRYIQATLATLGLIAIIVASVGMFNTLTVSLLERTREIGIMKALGIRRGDVRRIFMTEAMLIGILGGLMGLAFSVALQQVTIFIFQVLAIIAEGTVPRLFINPWYLPFGSLCFSVLIALATGIYPANRAAKLNPIEAIRYE